jgi:hypothetical protein
MTSNIKATALIAVGRKRATRTASATEMATAIERMPGTQFTARSKRTPLSSGNIRRGKNAAMKKVKA